MCVCNLQFVKLGGEKSKREIRWKKKKTRVISAARSKMIMERVNVVLQADGDHGFVSDVKKELKQN